MHRAAVTMALLVSWLGACGSSGDGVGTDGGGPGEGFLNVSRRIDFVNSSDRGDLLGGVGWFDYDGDGDLDVLFTNGIGQQNGLFRNDGAGNFDDVSIASGIAVTGGHRAVVAGDLDNDGDQDLFLAGDGAFAKPIVGVPHTLLRNNGDGTFVDVTEAAGLSMEFPRGEGMGILGDIDHDGFLDLFVARTPQCIGGEGADVCASFERVPDLLYHNDGDFTFTEIGAAAGLGSGGGACAAAFSDWDDDGWIDLYVINCDDNNIELLRNRGDLTFEPIAQPGFDLPEDWMGTAFADYDGDGDLDFFSTNNGNHGMFELQDDGQYVDVAESKGLWVEFGWGCSFADFDNDGDQDLVMTGSLLGSPGSPTRVWLNDGTGDLVDRTADLGLLDLSLFATSGLAVADFDDDGYDDFAIALSELPGANGRPVIYKNQWSGNHWIAFETVGTTSNLDGVGAKLWLRAGDKVQVKERQAGTSFASTESKWVSFGLGQATSMDSVEVRWPSGRLETFGGLAVDARHTLVEGAGVLVVP